MVRNNYSQAVEDLTEAASIKAPAGSEALARTHYQLVLPVKLDLGLEIASLMLLLFW